MEGLLVQIVPNLQKFCLVDGYGKCWKDRRIGCKMHQISKEFSRIMRLYWQKCQEPNCNEPGTHYCVSKRLVCCKHAFRFGFHHQIRRDGTCCCTIPFSADTKISRWLEKYGCYYFDPVDRKYAGDAWFWFTVADGGDHAEDVGDWIKDADKMDVICLSSGGFRKIPNFEDGEFIAMIDDHNAKEYMYILRTFEHQVDVRIRISKLSRKLPMLLEEYLDNKTLHWSDFDFDHTDYEIDDTAYENMERISLLEEIEFENHLIEEAQEMFEENKFPKFKKYKL